MRACRKGLGWEEEAEAEALLRACARLLTVCQDSREMRGAAAAAERRAASSDLLRRRSSPGASRLVT
jgi:hypothetical protein